MRELKKRQKKKEELNTKRNMEDYFSYQENRRAVSSFSLSRSYTKRLDPQGKRQITAVNNRNLSQSVYNARYYDEYREIQESQEKLKQLNKRLQEKAEKRDFNLRNKIQPIKKHLNRINKVLKIMHEHEDDQMKLNLLSCTKKDKKVAEARKRKDKMYLYHYNEKEENFKQGRY